MSQFGFLASKNEKTRNAPPSFQAEARSTVNGRIVDVLNSLSNDESIRLMRGNGTYFVPTTAVVDAISLEFPIEMPNLAGVTHTANGPVPLPTGATPNQATAAIR